jgi:hypothetical protein
MAHAFPGRPTDRLTNAEYDEIFESQAWPDWQDRYLANAQAAEMAAAAAPGALAKAAEHREENVLGHIRWELAKALADQQERQREPVD